MIYFKLSPSSKPFIHMLKDCTKPEKNTNWNNNYEYIYIFSNSCFFLVLCKVRLDQFFHKFDLIETGFEEETGKGRQCFFTEVAPTVKIVTTSQITFSQMVFVGA